MISGGFLDKQIKKKKWPPKRILTIGIVTSFIIVVFYLLIFGDHSSKLNVDGERLTISTVAFEPFQEYIPVTGEIRPIETYYLDVAEGGRVVRKFVEEGAFLEINDPIIQLENPDLTLRIMYNEANLFGTMNSLGSQRLYMEQNKLQLQSSILLQEFEILKQKRLYSNNKKLFEKNLISQIEFEESRDDYQYLLKLKELTLKSNRTDSLFRLDQINQLEFNVKRMKTNLDMIRAQMENLTVRAPIKGQLTALKGEIGQSINRGQNLGQIDDIENYKIRVEIDEHYLSKIQEGLIGEFPFAGKDYKVAIKTVFVQVTNGRFEVDCLFMEDVPEGIRRGQTVRIKLQLSDLSDAVTIDRGGFFQSTGGQWAFVIDPSGDFAVKRDISLGRQNSQEFEVLSGLQKGERVITSSYDNYGDVEKLVFK